MMGTRVNHMVNSFMEVVGIRHPGSTSVYHTSLRTIEVYVQFEEKIWSQASNMMGTRVNHMVNSFMEAEIRHPGSTSVYLAFLAAAILGEARKTCYWFSFVRGGELNEPAQHDSNLQQDQLMSYFSAKNYLNLCLASWLLSFVFAPVVFISLAPKA